MTITYESVSNKQNATQTANYLKGDSGNSGYQCEVTLILSATQCTQVTYQ